jgi:hypothetical protein
MLVLFTILLGLSLYCTVLFFGVFLRVCADRAMVTCAFLMDYLYLVPGTRLEGATVVSTTTLTTKQARVSSYPILHLLGGCGQHSAVTASGMCPELDRVLAGATHAGRTYVRIDYSTIMTTPLVLWGHLRFGWPTRCKYCYYLRLSDVRADRCIYPPYAPYDREMYARKITRAILQLQFKEDGLLRRQYSCNVTRDIAMLAGPRGDFYTHSGLGSQLSTALVMLHLAGATQRLLDSFTKQGQFTGMVAVPPGRPKVPGAGRPREVLLKLRCELEQSATRFVLDLNSYEPI